MSIPWITRTRKPHSQVRVNQGHPLARDIAFFYYATRGYAASNATFYDAVTGKAHGSGSGQTAGSSTDPIGGGKTSLFTSSAKTTGTAFQNPRAADTLQQTVFGRYKATAKPASKGAVLFYGNSSGNRGAFVGLDSSGFAIGGTFSTNGMAGYAKDAVDHLNQWINVAGSGDGTGNGQSSVWVNGVKGTNGASGSSGGTAVNQVNIGQDPTVYFNSITAEIACFIGWNRLLTDAEHRQISANPWQILLPVFDPKYFTFDGGGSPDITLALTGVSATGSAGSVTVGVAFGPTGVSGTGSAGDVTPAQGLTGVSATGSVGTATPSITIALTGVSATGSVGTVTYSGNNDLTLGLTGVSATGSIGSVTPSETIAATGVNGTGQVGDVSPGQGLTGVGGTGQSGSSGINFVLSLTGVSGTGQVGTVTADAAGDKTFALTGVFATGLVGSVSIPSAAGQGGHFLPLTEKQHRELKKKHRRDQKLQDDLDHSRKLDADAIEAEIRANLAPGTIKQENTVIIEPDEIDEEDADLEVLLLHA